MKMNKYIKLIRLVLVSAFSFFTFKAINLFYRGYHNLDLAFNFLNLGYKIDFTLNQTNILLKDAYINGLNQMISGFGWLCLVVIIGIFLGYSLCKDNKLN